MQAKVILVILSATLLFSAKSTGQEQFFWMCSGDTLNFEITEPYWGVPMLDYRAWNSSYQELGEWGGESIVVDSLSTGIYRIRLVDENCGESYNNTGSWDSNYSTVEIQVLPCPDEADSPCGGLSSINWGGHEYELVEIGNQCWFKENLRYSGNIPEVTSQVEWTAIWNSGNPTEQPAWCYYDNNPQNGDIYGKLYNWYAVNTGTLCPEGWHVPTWEEFETLADTLGGYGVAGGKMKSVDGWIEPNVGGTNESGFTGLPGRNRDGIGGLNPEDGFNVIEGSSGYWWTSSIFPDGNPNPLLAIQYSLTHSSQALGWTGSGVMNEGYSCRCIKDSDDIGTVLNPATGRIWMDKNLGASQVATSPTDTLAYGDLYQWGRGTDGHEKRDSETTFEISSSPTPGHDDFIVPVEGPPKYWPISISYISWFTFFEEYPNLWSGVEGINNPCPDGFRIPTLAEWEEERNSWENGAFSSPLKLTLGGRRIVNFGNPFINLGPWQSGLIGSYWSSTPGAQLDEAFNLGFDNDGEGGTAENDSWLFYGRSVRCIKED